MQTLMLTAAVQVPLEYFVFSERHTRRTTLLQVRAAHVG
jgi:hypothetical protein